MRLVVGERMPAASQRRWGTASQRRWGPVALMATVCCAATLAFAVGASAEQLHEAGLDFPAPRLRSSTDAKPHTRLPGGRPLRGTPGPQSASPGVGPPLCPGLALRGSKSTESAEVHDGSLHALSEGDRGEDSLALVGEGCSGAGIAGQARGLPCGCPSPLKQEVHLGLRGGRERREDHDEDELEEYGK